MKHTNQLMLMVAQFLYGDYAAETFSYDFPAMLSVEYDAFSVENPTLCDLLENEMPELCASFDPHGTGDPDTLDEARFREKVLQVYQDALPLSESILKARKQISLRKDIRKGVLFHTLTPGPVVYPTHHPHRRKSGQKSF